MGAAISVTLPTLQGLEHVLGALRTSALPLDGSTASAQRQKLHMTPTPPSLLRRIAIAVGSFFSIVARPDLAAQVDALRRGVSVPVAPKPVEPAPVLVTPASVAPPPPPPAPVAPPMASETAALQLLGLLQREARFVDFVQEDVVSYTDAEVGAAARVVHEGCRKVLGAHFSIAPVRSEPEGSRVTLAAGFDATEVRLTGNVVGQAPFTGTLGHRGWRVTEARLPQLTDEKAAAILAQAEVEL